MFDTEDLYDDETFEPLPHRLHPMPGLLPLLELLEHREIPRSIATELIALFAWRQSIDESP